MENKKEFVINVLYYALIFGLVYLFCNYLLGIIGPFLLGFIFAYFAVRLAKKIFKKETKIKRVIALVILYLVVVAILTLLVILGINEISGFIAALPGLYKQYVEPVLQGINFDLNNLPADVQADFTDLYSSLLESIKAIVTNLSSSLVSSGSSIISGTTGVLIGTLTTIITSFFAVYDYEEIIWYFESIMDDRTREVYEEVKDYLFNTVFLVIRSYVIIMLFTFIELLIGLGLFGIDNFILVAMMISVLDILPVLGVGTVLIPWSIFEFIAGKAGLGIGLLVLYLIITVIRNIIEPKLVGGNLGIHPLATLFAMLVGLELFGILGLFGLPLVLSFFVKRNNKQKLENSI